MMLHMLAVARRFAHWTARYVAGSVAFASCMFRAHAACGCLRFCFVEHIQFRHHATYLVCHPGGSFCRPQHVTCFLHQTFQHALCTLQIVLTMPHSGLIDHCLRFSDCFAFLIS